MTSLASTPTPSSLPSYSITLRETLYTGWSGINTPRHLRGCLLYAARLLDRLGHADLASQWRQRVRAMPRTIGAEAINIILMAACLELTRRGITDSDGHVVETGGAL